MKYIVKAKEVYDAIGQLARALGEKDYRYIAFERWEIGKKIYRISEPTECRVIAFGEDFKPILIYEYEIEEVGADK